MVRSSTSGTLSDTLPSIAASQKLDSAFSACVCLCHPCVIGANGTRLYSPIIQRLENMSPQTYYTGAGGDGTCHPAFVCRGQAVL
ncbi:hypothetical protein BD626DRAFT_477494 [Schizophyllum amplum]|uniref:Uncharacterized protein n=1 Tax=Schizophyllum amplum TaxID=97359 RepID=A0A550D087_9AGAR|nr:hypothetical protein BD626DRAFT_477494 [Auriculariopsis ampla]